MIRRFLSVFQTVFRYWRNDYLSIRVASVYIVLLAVIFYLLGGIHPRADYRNLTTQLETAQDDVRRFSGQMARQNDELNTLRARNDLQEKTISLLNTRFEEMVTNNIKTRERSAFYRQIFSDKTTNGDVTVYDLELNPGFAPQKWRIGAILVRLGRHKTDYTGGYYFEVLHGDEGAEKILRFPPEDTLPLTMRFYYEIDQLLTLPKGITPKNVRLIILDKENNIAASEEFIKQKTDDKPDETDEVNADENEQ